MLGLPKIIDDFLPTPPWKCDICGKEFGSNRALSVHYTKVHTEAGRESCRRSAWCVGLTKETDPRVAQISESLEGKPKSKSSWCKGLTKETDPRIAMYAEKLKGHKAWNKDLTKETDIRVAKQSEHQKGRVPWNKNLTGLIPWNKNKKGVQTAWNKGLTKESDERVARYARKLVGHVYSDEHNRNCGWQRGLTKETDSRIAKTAHTLSEKARTDPEYYQHLIDNGFRSLVLRKPTRMELQLNELLQINFPSEWKYVGNGAKKIGRRNPDFISTDGKRQVIEFFGERWHNILDEGKKINYYHSKDYDCLIIWESELIYYSDKVMERVRRFINEYTKVT